jgi:hypothetical protein
MGSSALVWQAAGAAGDVAPLKGRLLLQQLLELFDECIAEVMP